MMSLRALSLVIVQQDSQVLLVRLLLVHQHPVKMAEPVQLMDLVTYVLVQTDFQVLTAR